MIKLLLFTLSLAFSIEVFSQSCESFYFSKKAPDEIYTEVKKRLDESFENLENIKLIDRVDDFEILSNNKFYQIDENLNDIDNALRAMREFHSEKEIQDYLGLYLQTNEKRLLNFQKSILADAKTSFRPNEYEIMSYINHRLEKFNKLLAGSDVSLLYSIPKINPRTKALASQVESLMANQEKVFDNLFPTSGFKSYLGLQRHLSKVPEVQEVLKQVRNETVEFAMFRPNSGRWWIEKTGFKNQHVTNSSRGYDGKQGRNAVEASYLNKKYDPYAKLDDDLKPKYGALLPSFDSGVKFSNLHYGDDIYIFKKSVKDRVTFTIGDSLDTVYNNTGRDWTEGKIFKPESWDQAFIPWSKRELMVPYMKFDYHDTKYMNLLSTPIDGTSVTQTWSKHTSYLELQYWGELKIDDVKDFIFLNQPPTKEFYQFLRSKRINVYDGRELSGEGKRVLWQPEE